jgi:hypothetical protein
MNYPYVLIMKNSPYGPIWQVYIVKNHVEEFLLSRTAYINGFTFSKESIGYTKETCLNWRDSPGWKAYVKIYKYLTNEKT